MKHAIFAFFFSLLACAGWAQNTVSGKVIDGQTGKGLAGATVLSNSGEGSTTDREGRFQLACKPDMRITISYVGYSSVRRAVNNCGEFISITLQPGENALENIEISATSTHNKSLLYQPVSITKLSSTELKRGNGLFLDDAINGNVPGVTMQRRTVSAGQSFNIRGYGNGTRGTNGISSNFDGQGYKVYLNGIPVTDAKGITQMDDIDFGSIGNVEVTKGPSGTLYGLAIAGVVNLHTIEPERGKTSIGQEVMLGSYGLQRFTTHFQTSGANSSLLINYGYQHSDGFMDHNESTKRFINAAGDFRISDHQSIRFYASHSLSYDQRGGELTLDQYANFDYSGNPNYIKRDAHSEVNSFRAGIGHTWKFSDKVTNTTSVFGTAATTNSSSAAGWTDKNPQNFGARSTFDLQFNLANGISLSSITGGEWQTQHAQTIGYTMVENPNDPAAYWIIGNMRSNQSTKSATGSLFTEWTLALQKGLSVTAGVGVSNMDIALDNRFYVANSTSPTHFQKNYTGMVSPHVAINKVFSDQVSAYASYSRGYKAPVSSYFYIPATGELNTDLKPEVGDQFEVGTKGVLLNGRLSYELALFRAVFSDKMTAIAVPLNANTTAYSYVANGGDQKDNGMEALVKYTLYSGNTGFLRMIWPFGNITWSDFKYDGFQFQKLDNPPTSATTTDYSGKAVAGVPKVMANLGVDITTRPGLYANINYLYKDGFPITSDGAYYSSSYMLLNAKLGIRHNLGSHFDVDAYAGVYNITGTQYPYMVFVNQLPDAYLPAPYKANYFGGINLKYNF